MTMHDTKANKTPVSCVIPTFSARHLLEKQKGSVLEALNDGDELLYVDDASTDDTTAWFQSTFEAAIHETPTALVFIGTWQFRNKTGPATCLALKKNLRFAAACNAGVKQAQHELIFLLNNDVYPESDVLDHLIPHFKKDDEVFAVGCLEYQGSERNGEPSGKNALFFERGLFQHSRASDMNAGETAWASGGSALFSKAKWQNLGGFDKIFYPAYWEDIDLSFRAKKQGWKVLFEPKAVVYHQHETSNASVFGMNKIALMSWRHAFVFTWKHASLPQKLTFLLWFPVWFWYYSKTWFKTIKRSE